nr:ankyrin homolog [Procambarus clarkii]
MSAARAGRLWVAAVFLTHQVFAHQVTADAGAAVRDYIKAGDFAAAKTALELDSSLLNWRDTEGQGLLHVSAMYGALTLAEFILEATDPVYPINLATKTTGETALHWAAKYQNAELVNLLCNAQDSNTEASRLTDGFTPLMVAASKDFRDGVSSLIVCGANMEHKTSPGGMTALMVAAKTNHINALEELLDAGAQPGVQDATGKTPLMFCIQNKNEEATRLILQKQIDINKHDKDGSTALMLAARSGSPAILKLVLARHPILDLADHLGSTALVYAANNDGRLALLEAGASMEVQDKQGDTPLMRYTRESKRDGVLLLLQFCPDLTHHNMEDKTALKIAEEKEYKFLIQAIKGKLRAACEHNDASYSLGYTRFESCVEMKCNRKCNWEKTGKTDPQCDALAHGGAHGGDHSDVGDYGVGVSCAVGHRLECCRCCQCVDTFGAGVAAERVWSNVSAAIDRH